MVDLDLEKFFDQVNHDILMGRVARKIKDKRLLKLLRSYLKAGIMKEGLLNIREAGTPQGSLLSPLLSNIILDDFDQELERRGHRFCRYADDANVYVSSKRAGERVMASLTRIPRRKHALEGQSKEECCWTTGRPWRRKFLGYTVIQLRIPRLKPAPESIKQAKERIRKIINKGRGQSIGKVIGNINQFTRGWVG